MDLLWEFNQELSDGRTPDWKRYLRRCPRSAQRAELLADMICTEADLAGWDSRRISRRLALYATYDRSKAGRISVVRGLYADRIARGEYVRRDSIASVGISLDALQLRARDERVYLGQTIGRRYRLEQILGIGRFGVVYLASEIRNGRLIAVKTIRGENQQIRRLARSLLAQEAKSMAALRHPGIPQLIGSVKERASFSIALQYIEGGTLLDLFRQGRLPPRRAAAIVAAIADALDFAHRQGYIHRDLTLANVLVDKMDRPYLADFGLALSNEDQFDRDGQWAGTNGYMAVESVLGMTRQMDGRTDIWSAGVILYELLTGSPLIGRSSREEALVHGVLLDRRRLKYPREVPKQLRAIGEKCLSRDPNDRFHTAGLLRSALREFLKEPSDGKS